MSTRRTSPRLSASSVLKSPKPTVDLIECSDNLKTADHHEALASKITSKLKTPAPGKISSMTMKLRSKREKLIEATSSSNKKSKKLNKTLKIVPKKPTNKKKNNSSQSNQVDASTDTPPLSQSMPESSSLAETALQTTSSPPIVNEQTPTNCLIELDIAQMQNLKAQLKKATVKFDKACRQLVMLDQHMSDLQNSYTNSLENDRKTFKIVYRMQLATLEGTHNAYIEYIERQVEKIKKLKLLLFSDANLHSFTVGQTNFLNSGNSSQAPNHTA